MHTLIRTCKLEKNARINKRACTTIRKGRVNKIDYSFANIRWFFPFFPNSKKEISSIFCIKRLLYFTSSAKGVTFFSGNLSVSTFVVPFYMQFACNFSCLRPFFGLDTFFRQNANCLSVQRAVNFPYPFLHNPFRLS